LAIETEEDCKNLSGYAISDWDFTPKALEYKAEILPTGCNV
jgi:hypothetical protein